MKEAQGGAQGVLARVPATVDRLQRNAARFGTEFVQARAEIVNSCNGGSRFCACGTCDWHEPEVMPRDNWRPTPYHYEVVAFAEHGDHVMWVYAPNRLRTVEATPKAIRPFILEGRGRNASIMGTLQQAVNAAKAIAIELQRESNRR